MDSDARKTLENELVLLEKELKEREASIPIHSIRPHQLIEIEELEDKVEAIKGLLKTT
jgi:hypothetical protein